METINTLVTLFFSFLKVGFTSFGGLSMVPLINSEMISHNFMTQSEVMDIVAIAEMTPGPLGLNCATFAGMRTAGVLGAFASCLGVVMPTLTVAYIAAIFFVKFKESKVMNNIMVGVRPSAIGMILGVVVTLMLSNYTLDTGGISFVSIGLSLFDLFLFFKLKLKVPAVILINAVLGILLFGLLGLN